MFVEHIQDPINILLGIALVISVKVMVDIIKYFYECTDKKVANMAACLVAIIVFVFLLYHRSGTNGTQQNSDSNKNPIMTGEQNPISSGKVVQPRQKTTPTHSKPITPPAHEPDEVWNPHPSQKTTPSLP